MAGRVYIDTQITDFERMDENNEKTKMSKLKKHGRMLN